MTTLTTVLRAGISECRRCGKVHEGPLAWRQFQQPVTLDAGEFRYWTMCPTTGDPILLWAVRESQAKPPSEPTRKPYA